MHTRCKIPEILLTQVFSKSQSSLSRRYFLHQKVVILHSFSNTKLAIFPY
jgi:hypothetical protein